MQAGDILFLDTNVLLSATDEGREYYTASNTVLSQAIKHGLHLAVCGQVLREYAVVATRPVAANGLGMQADDVVRNLGMFRNVSAFFEEPEVVTEILLELIAKHELVGARIHDASIVALMKAHRLPALVTTNIHDFHKFTEIEVFSIEETASAMGRT